MLTTACFPPSTLTCHSFIIQPLTPRFSLGKNPLRLPPLEPVGFVSAIPGNVTASSELAGAMAKQHEKLREKGDIVAIQDGKHYREVKQPGTAPAPRQRATGDDDFVPAPEPKIRKMIEWQYTQWFMADWTTWGWLETIAKAVGIAAGCLGFFLSIADGNDTFVTPADRNILRVLYILIMIVASMLVTLRIIDRFLDKEILSLWFAFGNTAAHWLMTWALVFRAEGPLLFYMIFLGSNILGEIFKMLFLYNNEDYTDSKDTPRRKIYAGVIMFLTIYSGCLVLAFMELASCVHCQPPPVFP